MNKSTEHTDIIKDKENIMNIRDAYVIYRKTSLKADREVGGGSLQAHFGLPYKPCTTQGKQRSQDERHR